MTQPIVVESVESEREVLREQQRIPDPLEKIQS
jgi:hypothetical protein